MKKSTVIKLMYIPVLFLILFFVSNCSVLNHVSEKKFLNSSTKEISENTENIITSNVVYSADAKNLDNGYGTFQESLRCLANDNRKLLLNGDDKDYKYAERLDDGIYNIYDKNNNGEFDENKYFRIIYEDNNIISKLNLIPVAKDLTDKISPPYNQIFIDPNAGSFLLPRPIYWCKCDDVDELVYPEINERVVTFNNGGNIFTTGATGAIGGPREMGKWGNSIHGIINKNGEGKLYPSNRYSKMNISFWLKLANEANKTPNFTINFDIQTQVSLTKSANINSWNHKIYNKFENKNYVSDTSNFDDFRHVYISFEIISTSERTVKVYIDNSLVMNSTFTIQVIGWSPNPFFFSFSDGGNNSGGDIWIDNIQTWKELVSDTPEWLYNSGDGREDALHYIYGEENGYKPQNIKVGYYYIN